ncbi:hypothetical protein RHMOL_Rhmol13G0227900 [Rhododendron molle]|uniref:Uncharacterized protein n=1 Tax=Rhododendron molle TaxID=49168 RepID=A0ACC0LB47_RHOML|nr:hypothetical protein RHMOL_Rhmol13G0227900 [Rhododendron molle]
MVEDPSHSCQLPNLEGYFGLFVILDRMPVPTAVPIFKDVFGDVPNSFGSMLDQHVRVDQLSRFKVLVRERRYINECLHGSMFTFKRFVKLGGRNVIMTTFKDMEANTSGRYGNVRDNALIMFVYWKCGYTLGTIECSTRQRPNLLPGLTFQQARSSVSYPIRPNLNREEDPGPSVSEVGSNTSNTIVLEPNELANIVGSAVAEAIKASTSQQAQQDKPKI